MLGVVDFAGIAAVIAAIGAIVTAVLAYLQRKPVAETHAAVQTNGDPRTLGEIVTETAHAVADATPGGGTPVVPPAPPAPPQAGP